MLLHEQTQKGLRVPKGAVLEEEDAIFQRIANNDRRYHDLLERLHVLVKYNGPKDACPERIANALEHAKAMIARLTQTLSNDISPGTVITRRRRLHHDFGPRRRPSRTSPLSQSRSEP